MAHLKPLQAITVLRLLTDDIEDGINKLSAFSVMTFSPVVTSTRLTKNKVIRPEDLSIKARSDTIHSTRLKIHKNSARHIPPATGFIVVDINPLKLKIGDRKSTRLNSS